MEFKVGDTVICVAPSNHVEYDCPVGYIAKITEVKKSSYFEGTLAYIRISPIPVQSVQAGEPAFLPNRFEHYAPTKLERAIYNILD